MRHIYKTFLFLFLLVFATESFSQSCTYLYRKRIRINYPRVSGGAALTNFPVLINITSDPNLVNGGAGHVQNANGWDIIFTAADGVTQLDHSLQKYTAGTGELVCYVRVPSVSATAFTYIYMYYGKAGIGADPSVTTAWDASTEGVWFLHNNVFTDKTANANNGTNNGTTTIAAQVANGADYATTNTRYVQVGTTGMTAAQGTVELWGRPASFLATETYYFGHTTQAAYQNRIQIYNIQNGASVNKLRLGMGDNHSVAGDIMTMVANTWYHIVLTWNAGTYVMYVNGAQVSTGAYANLSTLQTYADIGNDGNPGQRTEALRGYIDEVKTSSVARSAGWITTTYNNQSTPSTFYTIFPEAPRWTGATDNNWATATNWSPAVVPATGADIIVTNGARAITNLGANRNVASMWIQPGANGSVNMTTFTINVDTFEVVNCGTLTATAVSAGLLQFRGSISQYISGTGTTTLEDLTINNTAASNQLTLMKPVSMNGTLTMNLGNIYTTTTNLLSLSNTASATSGTATSFVSGPMAKTGSTNFSFPVGKGTWWRRLETNTISASSTFRVEYFNSAYASTTPVTSPLNNVSLMEYWQLDQTAGTGTAVVVLHFEDASASGINDCPDLTMGRWTGATWLEQPATAAGTCAGAGTGTVTTTASVASASFNRPFTFASKTPSPVNVLPIKLLSFGAELRNSVVDLDWATATETNNDFFTIEKTKDGKSFAAVTTVGGSGTTSQYHSYSAVDEQPYDGVSYYRLKQTDFDGKLSYSSLVAVNSAGSFDFSIFPNPSGRDNDINLSISGVEKGSEMRVSVYDITGRALSSSMLVAGSSGGNVYSLKPSGDLGAGVYLVTVTSGERTYRQRLVIK